MPEYCTISDVENRLTRAGYKFSADRDGDGAVGASEKEAITEAIEQAGTVIDEHITATRLITADYARSQAYPVLKHLAVDLAAYRIAGNGGRKVPQSLQDAFEDAMERLGLYRDGTLTIETEETTGGGIPKAIDPFRPCYRRRRRRCRY